jgi:uncharacterized protein YndB with AHSA1/START domain
MSAPTTASVSTSVAASPEAVYDLVADVTRMGDWSPECHRCEWQGRPGEVGSRFKGSNKRGLLLRWSTTAEVSTAERGREFAFHTLAGDKVSTRWIYRFEPDGDGTRVTETFESVFTPPLIAFAERTLLRNRQQQLEAGMAKTLARLKAVAEA